MKNTSNASFTKSVLYVLDLAVQIIKCFFQDTNDNFLRHNTPWCECFHLSRYSAKDKNAQNEK